MACKMADEYTHLVDSPYGAGPDAAKDRPATSQSAAAGPPSTSASRALQRVDGDTAPTSEAEAVRKAREVRMHLCSHRSAALHTAQLSARQHTASVLAGNVGPTEPLQACHMPQMEGVAPMAGALRM
jgi:hypothetical protein